MAVHTDPADYEGASLIMAKSDAGSNQEAIREITVWAREHGFVRTNENHLTTRRAADGQVYYQSPIFRVDDEIRLDAEESNRRNRERLASMPETQPSVSI